MFVRDEDEKNTQKPLDQLSRELAFDACLQKEREKEEEEVWSKPARQLLSVISHLHSFQFIRWIRKSIEIYCIFGEHRQARIFSSM